MKDSTKPEDVISALQVYIKVWGLTDGENLYRTFHFTLFGSPEFYHEVAILLNTIRTAMAVQNRMDKLRLGDLQAEYERRTLKNLVTRWREKTHIPRGVTLPLFIGILVEYAYLEGIIPKIINITTLLKAISPAQQPTNAMGEIQRFRDPTPTKKPSAS